MYSIANINRTGTGTFYLGSIATTGCNGLAPTDRLNCGYSNINFRGSDGTSNYYSFTPAIESSNFMGTGLVLTARYSYAVAKDNLSSTFSESGNNFNLGYTDPFNPSLDYGYADFDVRHRFIASAIYPIRFTGDNHVAKAIFDGWNISTIVDIESGTPFTIFDVTNCLVTTCYRLQNGGATAFNGTSIQNGANSFNYLTITGSQWGADPLGFNETGPYPNAFTRRNSFRGEGFWNADVSIFKNISVTERYKLQFRADVFNVFNHANFFVDGGSAFVNDPCVDTGTYDPLNCGLPVGAPDPLASGTVNIQKFGNRRAQVSIRLSF